MGGGLPGDDDGGGGGGGSGGGDDGGVNLGGGGAEAATRPTASKIARSVSSSTMVAITSTHERMRSRAATSISSTQRIVRGVAECVSFALSFLKPFLARVGIKFLSGQSARRIADSLCAC